MKLYQLEVPHLNFNFVAKPGPDKNLYDSCQSIKNLVQTSANYIIDLSKKYHHLYRKIEKLTKDNLNRATARAVVLLTNCPNIILSKILLV